MVRVVSWDLTDPASTPSDLTGWSWTNHSVLAWCTSQICFKDSVQKESHALHLKLVEEMQDMNLTDEHIIP